MNHEQFRRAGRAMVAFGTLFAILVWAPGVDAQMTPPPDFLVTSMSSHDFDETVARIKQSIEAENLMVLHEINPQQMLRMVGVQTGGMRQILFFHPRFMKQIVETNPNGGIVPPLKIMVMERPDGGVAVRYHDLVHLFAPYEGLDVMSTELKAMVERVVASVR